MEDQRDITQYKPEHIQEAWKIGLENEKARRLLFYQLFKGESKEDIECTINDWKNLSEEDKNNFITQSLGAYSNSNEMIDLIMTLKMYKNPVVALKIWKKNNNL